MQCETCSAPISVVDASHSVVIVLQKVDYTNGYSYHQCDTGEIYNGLSYQHFYCSEVHMKESVPTCINTHFAETDLHSPVVGSTNLDKQVFAGNLLCKVCGVPLVTSAYRFCLTNATPYNRVLDNSQNELEEWCCSLAHAQEQATKNLGQ